MKLKNIFLSATLGIAALSSCSDKMDYKEYNVYDDEYIKEMFGRVGGFMTKIYNDLESDFGNYSGALLASATDESVYSHPGNQIEDFYNGAWAPTNAKSSTWTRCWDGISYCNLVLDEFSGLTFPEYVLDIYYKEEMAQYRNYEWEARWARAFFYFELVRQYKNIPLKTRHMNADEANSLPQLPSDSIFKFIDDECAAIKDSIFVDYTTIGYPTQSETGRANKLAVLALRARAALYHASPLFNTNNDKNLWLEAAKRCKEVIDQAGQQSMTLAGNYSKLFNSDSWKDADAQKELIFGVRQAASNAFETTNGLAIDEDPEYDPQNPYANRDKRLGYIVACNGEQWPGSANNLLETFVGGANSSSVTYGTPTGYYLKKYCNSGTIIANNGSNSFYHIWVAFRLGEFYLDYAEAVLNYTGDGYTKPEGLGMSAADAINKIRKRAGQPDMATGLSFTEFTKKYENERFVELAFEGHRFFDLRRWKKAPEYLKTIRKMTITKNEDETLTFTPGTLETRTWDDKWYLFPFPQKDVQVCGYEQNPGWK